MSGVETYALRPSVEVSRIIRGGWQLAGGHGTVAPDQAIGDLMAAFDAGIFTFDCADIYTGVEALLGAVRARLFAERGAAAAARLRIHTKLVPDLSRLATLTRADVTAIIERSLQRLGADRLDLVQFHWWDYAVPGWLEVLGWLADLRRAGKVADVGVTNFDTPHLAAIIASGIPLVSLQTQYSLLDGRSAAPDLTALCGRHGISLLCYGTVAGGFFSERWRGVAEPSALENRSLVKYKLIIDDFGGWALFQALLDVLAVLAARHRTDIASIATRWTLDQPHVAAAIVGARNRVHLDRHVAIGGLTLDDADRAALAAVLAARQGPLGEPYALERDRTGRHGAIMKYELNVVAV